MHIETTTLNSEGVVKPAQDFSATYSWYVVFALMACYMLSFIDRQILSLLVAPIKQELAISDTQIGLLLGLAFAGFYTLVGMPLGRIADTSNRRNLIAIGIFLWSAMTALSAFASSYSSLFMVRMGVGIGEAALSPAAFSIIYDYFYAKKRLSLAISVYTMGIFVGSGLAFILGGAVVDAVLRWHTVTLPLIGTISSWRLSFLVVGLPGFLFVLLVYTIKEPPRRNVLRGVDGSVSRLPLAEVVKLVRQRARSVIGIAFGMVFQALSSFAFFNWVPTFFQRTHGWTAGQTGSSLGLIVVAMGCSGMFLGGTLSDRWQRRGVPEAPLRVTALSAIGTGIPFVIAMLIADPTWSLVLIAIGTFFVAMPIGSAYASVQYIFPNQARGQVSAFVMFILNLGGISLGAFLPGYFNNHLFHSEQAIGYSIALTIGAASFLQYIIFRSTYASYRRDYLSMHPATV